tara:strand:- start:35 stop:418 length:384 start_codon:yes stop_codon:yes gene_type:complete
MKKRQRNLIHHSYLLLALGICLTASATAQFYTDVTEETLVGQLKHARSVAFGDYNNDGWQDLFVVEEGVKINLLYNDGNGDFSDQTAAIRRLEQNQVLGGGAIVGDYDNDGDVDLFLPQGIFFKAIL